ncbi:MAG: hypothetical protein NW226_04690 [Microscillaceae bacterium]|nr:hypothetical protein [Microscillaceae bacterium]
MLRFQDANHLEQILSYMEGEYESWNDAFESQWGHLNEDAYNAKIEELSFDENKTLRDFEILLRHNSLRTKVYIEEDTWLNNETLDLATDPENKTAFEDDFLRTVLNNQGEIRIKDSIYIEKPYNAVPRTNPATPNAAIFFRIKATETTLLQTIRSKSLLIGKDFTSSVRDGTGFLYGKATIIGNTFYTEGVEKSAKFNCIPWKRNARILPYENGNKAYKIVASLRSYFFVPRIAAKTVSYKKSNGKWKRLSTRLIASFSGILYDNNCSLSTPIPPRRKEKYRKRVGVNINGNFGSIILQVVNSKNPYDIDSYHYCNGQQQIWGVH